MLVGDDETLAEPVRVEDSKRTRRLEKRPTPARRRRPQPLLRFIERRAEFVVGALLNAGAASDEPVAELPQRVRLGLGGQRLFRRLLERLLELRGLGPDAAHGDDSRRAPPQLDGSCPVRVDAAPRRATKGLCCTAQRRAAVADADVKVHDGPEEPPPLSRRHRRGGRLRSQQHRVKAQQRRRKVLVFGFGVGGGCLPERGPHRR
mmetsp:Transcript_1975/g.7202  ORF Transcript_1975/g.7202 Transcript_1975/m.7202 type:complete len:205 (+) Transcript_1975:2515-3129(+)